MKELLIKYALEEVSATFQQEDSSHDHETAGNRDHAHKTVNSDVPGVEIEANVEDICRDDENLKRAQIPVLNKNILLDIVRAEVAFPHTAWTKDPAALADELLLHRASGRHVARRTDVAVGGRGDNAGNERLDCLHPNSQTPNCRDAFDDVLLWFFFTTLLLLTTIVQH